MARSSLDQPASQRAPGTLVARAASAPTFPARASFELASPAPRRVAATVRAAFALDIALPSICCCKIALQAGRPPCSPGLPAESASEHVQAAATQHAATAAADQSSSQCQQHSTQAAVIAASCRQRAWAAAFTLGHHSQPAARAVRAPYTSAAAASSTQHLSPSYAPAAAAPCCDQPPAERVSARPPKSSHRNSHFRLLSRSSSAAMKADIITVLALFALAISAADAAGKTAQEGLFNCGGAQQLGKSATENSCCQLVTCMGMKNRMFAASAVKSYAMAQCRACVTAANDRAQCSAPGGALPQVCARGLQMNAMVTALVNDCIGEWLRDSSSLRRVPGC